MRRRRREAEVVVGPAVPGSAVWAATAVLVAGMLALAWSTVRPLSVGSVVFCVAVGLLVALWPQLSFVGLALVLVGGAVFVGGPPAAGVTLTLVLLVHLAVWASALAVRVAWSARVEVGVLLDGLRDVLVVQVPSQAVALVALALAGVHLHAGDVWRVAALVAGAAVVVLVLPLAEDG